MNILFETQLAITSVEGRLVFCQAPVHLETEPVILPDPVLDGKRMQVKTVLQDGGRYRMWYYAFPQYLSGGDHAKGRYITACAESDDGRIWRRPALGLVKAGPKNNNYCDLNVDSIFIDPDAPANGRYRATTYRPQPLGDDADHRGLGSCFYTAHSSDGFHWELDSRTPRWYSGDVITCAYHSLQQRGLATIKYVRLVNGMHRRAVWTADYQKGVWGDPVCALTPDALDDLLAQTRGYNSTDFYSMALLPAGAAFVGFVLNFRHHLPLSSTPPQYYGIYGGSDITLTYQQQPGDRWLQLAGRPSLLPANVPSWATGWIGPCSSPVAVGDEHWLFVACQSFSHAWELAPDWRIDPKWARIVEAQKYCGVTGLVRWPKWRLMGCHAEPEGALDIELGKIAAPSRLVLNYATKPGGNLRVQLYSRDGRLDKTPVEGRSEPDEIIPLEGDHLEQVVAWKTGAVIPPGAGRQLVARISMENAALYAWTIQPV